MADPLMGSEQPQALLDEFDGCTQFHFSSGVFSEDRVYEIFH